MFDVPTALILGAGSSNPYGFPTGTELNEGICSNFLQNYSDFFNDAHEYEQTLIPVPQRAKNFLDHFNPVTDSQSIDLFLSRNYPIYYKIGILSIIYQILLEERRSALFTQNSQIVSDWYSLLFKKITCHIKVSNDFSLDLDKLTIITFNYDRSLERYLYRGLINTFEILINPERIIDELNKLKIIHVYGKIGSLEWQNDEVKKIKYGCDPHIDVLNNAMKNIQITYNFRKNGSDDNIRKIITNSEIIYFLGFGYDEDNLKNIGYPDFITSNKKIYGTAYGIKGLAENRLKGKFKPCRPQFRNTCYELLNEFPL